MTHHLTPLFRPRSIAVFGGSERQDAVGRYVLQNLISGGYAGELHIVNPKHESVLGRPCLPSLAELGKSVDLAVIATPAHTVPGIIQQCGEYGVRAAIVLSAGFLEAGTEGNQLTNSLLDLARRFGVRLLGPNCLGVVSTNPSMNATFAKANVKSGSLALVSQSGALCTAILDWAEEVGVGFSNVVSIGDAVDVGIGEVLDYLSMDPATHAILLYVEGVRDARRFMSGLRVAARLKPTIVLKAGKHDVAARAARTHTGALVGSDDVFAAALRRAGAVRAETIGQLFSAARLLAPGLRAQGQRLAVVSNAGGPGVMAADRAAAIGVELAELTPKTLQALDECLPAHWSRGNPVDVLGDATPERYRRAVRLCLDDPNVDGLLVMLTPQAMTEPMTSAEAVIAAKDGNKPVVACWMGGRQVNEARSAFRSNGIPHFNTPEASMDAFAFLWAHHQNQRLLLQVTSPLPFEPLYDVEGARLVIESALHEHRTQLSAIESKAILKAFGIDSSLPIRVDSANDALVAAESLGFPVVLKIDAPEITHKSDVGGVIPNITDAREVRHAFDLLMKEVRRHAPSANLRYATVERMYRARHGRELMIGVIQDECFGPAISVGAGGTLVEIMQDRAVSLPPLTTLAVREMIQRTRAARLLNEWRGHPAANQGLLEQVLLRVSDMVCELPEIAELDINPLVVDEAVAIALDARIMVRPVSQAARRYAHMAVHPYPADLSIQAQLANGTEVKIRPIRPEDAEAESAFVRSLSDESRFFRFMHSLNELTPEMLVRFTQIDYDREMAFIAIVDSSGTAKQIGVSRYVTNPDGVSCEFALVVSDEWQRQGVGTRLMKSLIDVARQRGLKLMQAEISLNNHAMIALVRGLGFSLKSLANDANVLVATRFL